LIVGQKKKRINFSLPGKKSGSFDSCKGKGNVEAFPHSVGTSSLGGSGFFDSLAVVED
jgi:hypothetical protein